MKRLLYLPIVLSALISCTGSQKSLPKSQSTKYSNEPNTLHPQFMLFNVSDTTSELNFKLFSKELLYTRPDGINFSSNVLINYRLLPSFDAREILDSASTRVVDENNSGEEKYIIGKLIIHAKKGKKYSLKIKVVDINRNTSVDYVMDVHKENDLNAQNFYVETQEYKAPVFSNVIKMNEEVKIKFKAKLSVDVYVRYYHREFPLAPPPFADYNPKPFQYKADSTFTLQLTADGSMNFSTSKRGFYHFQLDTSKREGLTLFCFSDDFPQVKHPDDMILPLRFITSYEEYEAIRNSNNKKLSVENFWIKNSGSNDRAREIIRNFYNRMQDGNMFFTSYIEGWKTDRGMVYLIFGPPATIYRNVTSETWLYGEENNINSLQFFFTKVINPFTDNDYILERSTSFKQPWYNAVENWRSGRVVYQN